MKNNIIIALMVISFTSCKQSTIPDQSLLTIDSIDYHGFGANIDTQSLMTMSDLANAYAFMSPMDTVYGKVRGEIKEVCSKKGCWMTLDMGSGNNIMVRFKDYGFFMPLDAEGYVILRGKAYVSETSIDDLKHYAEDAGASKQAIEAIVSPKKTYSFEADGALLVI